jgi:hypothetical protein
VSLLAPGAALVALVMGLSALLFGGAAVVAAGAFGLLALAIQVVAYRLALRPAAPRAPFPPGWLWGTALRFGGVILLAVAVLLNRKLFPPLPAALGYLGVLIPLLVLELRRTR